MEHQQSDKAQLVPITSYLSKSCFDGETVDPTQDLIMSGALDSLAVMQFTAFLETHFAIKIPAQDITIAVFETPLTVSNYITQRQKEAV
ncbi:MAG: acyl carrier protein [Paracoccaceae bacterium]